MWVPFDSLDFCTCAAYDMQHAGLQHRAPSSEAPPIACSNIPEHKENARDRLEIKRLGDYRQTWCMVSSLANAIGARRVATDHITYITRPRGPKSMRPHRVIYIALRRAAELQRACTLIPLRYGPFRVDADNTCMHQIRTCI